VHPHVSGTASSWSCQEFGSSKFTSFIHILQVSPTDMSYSSNINPPFNTPVNLSLPTLRRSVSELPELLLNYWYESRTQVSVTVYKQQFISTRLPGRKHLGFLVGIYDFGIYIAFISNTLPLQVF